MPKKGGASRQPRAPTARPPPPKEAEDKLPANWPLIEEESEGDKEVASIPYLRQPTYSPAITPALLQALNRPTKDTAHFPKFHVSSLAFPNPDVFIAPITDPTHPSYPQSGLYASRLLAPGTFILPYLGRYHLNIPSDTNAESDYDISLDRDAGVAIDCEKEGNEARFINDYRDIYERPNAEFRDVWVQLSEGNWQRWLGVWVVGVGRGNYRKGGIARGEEIVVSYGKGFWKKREEGDGSALGEADKDEDEE